MKQSWGALPEDWDAFSRIAAGDIWPCVSNPSIPRARSKLDVDNSPVGKDFAKVPSGINNDGEAHRYSGWTTLTSTQMQLNAWRAIPDLSFGVVGRKLKGIDIDIDDKATAYVVGIREERDYNLGDELGKQAAAWLDQNHPDWRDPLAYWE